MRRVEDVVTHIFLLIATLVAAPAVAEPLPRVALIIDDVGYRLVEGERAVRLPGAVAVAVLPFGTHSVTLAREADAQGKEVVLHLPMQPLRGAENPGPGALEIGQSRAELATVLAADLAAVPFVVGVSNHMGSLLTQQADQMGWLMDELRRREPLFFVDSYTTAASIGFATARAHGVPALRRDVFLDADPAPAAIEAQWQRLLALARAHGMAVGIGHPYSATLALLERELPALEASGVALVPLSVLLQGGAP
ncbi:MAG: divergent polysaccharide deacetylase family protein [Gammaproteobacteria bacterium]